MTRRLPRSALAAYAAAFTLFALVALMVVRAPAGATPPEGSGKPSGSTMSPQPKSNADMNKGGANNGGDCGAYCSTRDGSPSGNGNGKGEAKGKPCAGCVGKADNKNPPGQQPDGTDHNAGYECDRNHGIGRTNPAHTGCKTGESPSPTPSETACVPTEQQPCETPSPSTSESPCVPTEEQPCETPSPSVSASVTESPCVPTEEQPCDTPSPTPSESVSETPTPEVSDTTLTQSPTPSVTASVQGVKIVRPPATGPTSLPTTGSPIPVGLLLLLGFGLVGFGTAMTVRTPSRH
jgi:hypothetical protein